MKHFLFSIKTLSMIIRVILAAFPFVTLAQDQERPPMGESFNGRWANVGYDSKMLKAQSGRGTIVWSPPEGREITYAAEKFHNENVIFIELDNGSVYEMIGNGDLGWDIPTWRSDGGLPFNKLVGDALYGIASTGVTYVSRDTAATWQIDTVGLGSGYPFDLTLDSLQYVYLAYSTGLFKQPPDSSTWQKVSSFPGTNTSAVFVDRMNRVFVASSRKVYMSTNSGSTWNIDTAGMTTAGYFGSTGFCDDAFGNIYARNALRLFRSTGGTQPWVRIDQPLSALAFDPSVNLLFNNLSGDSLLYASTVFGSYISSDQGTTWNRDTSQFSASFIYGLSKTPAGRLLTTTNLGVYYKNPGDLQWTKTFPATGFVAASPVFVDGSGNAYALGAKTDRSNFQSLPANWKSTDGGLIWNPDTSGIGGLAGQNPTYYVDETGTQHYGAYGAPARFYSKTPGQSWAADTAGYGIGTSDLPTAFGSDRHGFLYVATNSLSSYKGMVWKRPIAGGTWVPDTAGLAGTQVYWITADKNGIPLAGAIDGLYKKNGTAWIKLPSPSGLTGYAAFVVSADSSGYTIAGFSTPYGYNYFWRGLYATNDNGATWKHLGLDSISVRGLVSYGDTTFAYTYADGIYKVRSTVSVNSVAAVTHLASFRLEQNYPNPFNPTTNLRFTIGNAQFVSFKIYDVLGREVSTLIHEKLSPGNHIVSWNASNLSSGVYFYRLQTGNFVETKKMVLMK